jgi:hypothetical protein
LDHIQISNSKLSDLRLGNEKGNWAPLLGTVFHELSHIAGLPDEETWESGKDLYFLHAHRFEMISESSDGKFLMAPCLNHYEDPRNRHSGDRDHAVLRKRPKYGVANQ